MEYPRTSYGYTDSNKKFVFDFPHSDVGKILYKVIQGKKYLNLTSDQFKITYAYDRVPEIQANQKYKEVTKKVAKDSFARLEKKVLEYKPDLIVPFGNVGLMGITGKKGISSKRGLPVKQEFNDGQFSAWVIPTFSIENTFTRPETQKSIDSDIALIATFIREGEKAFAQGTGEYELVTDFNRLQEIFALLKTKGKDFKHPIAMDFETNSTNGSLQNVKNKLSPQAREMYKKYVDQSDTVSSKPIILSLSWEEKQGVAIPVEHKQSPWNKIQLATLIQNIRDLIEDDRWIVGHNFKFDIRYCMDTIGVSKATNCMDTMIMFFVGVDEEPTTTKGLKELAYRYTSMGGYDRELDGAKKDIIADSMVEAKKYYDEHGMKFVKSKVEPIANEVMGAGIDGGKFNYEWIDLNIIYPYAAGDTDATLRIFNVLFPIIFENKKWLKLITDFYPRLDDTLCTMEHNGIKLNFDRANELKGVYEKELDSIVKEIHDTVPEIQQLEDERRDKLEKYLRVMAIKAKDRTPEQKELQKSLAKYKGTNADPESKIRYNPSSRNDSKYVLYVVMGYQLPPERAYLTDSALKAKFGRDIDPDRVEWTDYKADKDALNYLVDTYNSDFAKLLLKYSKVSTLMNNFIVKLPKLADPNHLVHSRFIPTGTVTSRLASRDPATNSDWGR